MPPQTITKLTPKGQATRERILIAARQVFAGQGYEGTRVADIALAAGISHGNFYRHFADKDDVLQAVLAKPLTALRLSTAGRRVKPESPTLQSLSAQSAAYFRAYADHAPLFRVMREASAKGVTASFFEMWMGERHRFVQRTVRWLDALAASRAIDPKLHRQMLAESLGAMTEQMAYVQIGLAPQRPPDEHLDDMARCCGRVWFLSIFGTITGMGQDDHSLADTLHLA